MDYKEYTKMKQDKQQLKFGLTANLTNNDSFLAIEQYKLNFDSNVICPFCLTITKFDKGFKINKQFYQCLNCKNDMTKKTLSTIINMNPEEFAQWVYSYRLSGFFNKIKPDFKTWLNTLETFDNNYSRRFWNKYKELRGDIEE